MKDATYLVDTNLLVRILTEEPKAQAEAAKNFFARAGQGDLVLEIIPLIVAETYYTLILLCYVLVYFFPLHFCVRF